LTIFRQKCLTFCKKQQQKCIFGLIKKKTKKNPRSFRKP